MSAYEIETLTDEELINRAELFMANGSELFHTGWVREFCKRLKDKRIPDTDQQGQVTGDLSDYEPQPIMIETLDELKSQAIHGVVAHPTRVLDMVHTIFWLRKRMVWTLNRLIDEMGPLEQWKLDPIVQWLTNYNDWERGDHNQYPEAGIEGYTVPVDVNELTDEQMMQLRERLESSLKDDDSAVDPEAADMYHFRRDDLTRMDESDLNNAIKLLTEGNYVSRSWVLNLIELYSVLRQEFDTSDAEKANRRAEELYSVLPDPVKLIVLAEYIQIDDDKRGIPGTEVQDDLMRWAVNITITKEKIRMGIL